MSAVPAYTDVPSLYPGQADVSERYQALGAAFEAKYGQAPALYTRAPGRVNLIGEHIDYEGYGVLPMAIKLDTVVAIAKGGTQITVANLESAQYEDQEFPTDPVQEVHATHSWGNYFVCAYKGVFELLADKGVTPPEPCGLQVMMHGTVPLGSGLSSSAAFICSCFLAILGIHNLEATQQEVAEFSARAEKYVGVTCGGMDQAISMMGMQGVAKMIDFNPVRAQDVQLPEGATFVIANSLAVSNKAVGAHKRYNLRVVECRLAAAMLAHSLGAPADFCTSVKTLKELEPIIADKAGATTLAGCAACVVEKLPKDIYTHDEIETALGASLDSMFKGQALALKAVDGAKESGGFKLKQRAQHVYEEAQRVRDFKAVCDGNDSEAAKLEQLGKLMDDSHASCSKLYECSCPELEEVVSQAKAAGAVGARLTGAGWGGCTVSMVKEGQVDAFLKHLAEGYFAKKVKEGLVKDDGLDKVLFASKPSSGAAVLRLSSGNK